LMKCLGEIMKFDHGPNGSTATHGDANARVANCIVCKNLNVGTLWTLVSP
jgi:hypothetical protein